MSLYQNTISEVCDVLEKHKLEYDNTIIVGDNSSGKSEVLRQILRKNKEDIFYFIDAVNRYFNVAQVTEKSPFSELHYSSGIIEQRIEDDTFNHVDSFYYDKVPLSIESLYSIFSADIESLLKEFLDIVFDIQRSQTGWVAHVNGKEVDLSSGYQALIRIFIELLYVSSVKNTGTVIIDEIDEFLSAKNSGRIFNFLIKKFPNLKFIVTTHSADLIANADNCNLVLLEKDGFEVLDAGDFMSVSQVYDVFNSLFEIIPKDEKTKLNDSLRRFLNNKMSGFWSSEDDIELENIKKGKLTKAQRLVVKQIEEWKS